MRASKWVHAGAAFLFAASAGCNRGTPTAAATATAAKPQAASALVAFSAAGADGNRRIIAVAEDRGGAPVTLSAEGIDTVFVSALSGRRALLAERNDAGIARLVIASTDGTRGALGELPAGRYQGANKALVSGDVVVAELSRGDTSDLFALRAGAKPVLLVEGASLVAVAGDRAAFVSAGNVKSIKFDGSAPMALGGGDGSDRVAEVRADRLLLTLHASGAGDVRAVRIDGSGRADFGQPNVDERAFGFAGPDRFVFARSGSSGAIIGSAALDGTDERALTKPAQAATPLAIDGDGTVVFSARGGALMSVAASGGDTHVLDAAAGDAPVVSRFVSGRVLYIAEADTGSSLRAARLDGTGVAVLCERPLWLPFVTAVTADNRVLFHRALSGQLEGGQAFSVNLDGTDLRAMGTQVVATDGSGHSPADQDFEAITPAGNVILEAEFDGAGPRQLLIAAPGVATAHTLTGLSGIRYAGILP